YEIAFEADSALLLCSDGLTDLVDSSSIQRIVRRFAGRPQEVVRTLIEAANAAGGKDNVTVVYLEGERFSTAPVAGPWPLDAMRRPDRPDGQSERAAQPRATLTRTSKKQRAVQLALLMLLAAGLALALIRFTSPELLEHVAGAAIDPPDIRTIVVRPGESIVAAMERAQPGWEGLVEPGEYRETIVLKSFVRLRSRIPRAAVIRLPGSASEGDAALLAASVAGAVVSGFRIVGDAATPLGIGLLARDAELSATDLEITGAARVA